MGKIDELSLEIKKYTNIYNDILVGMHADINVYKKMVTSQAENTNKALFKLEENANELESSKQMTESLRQRSEEIYDDIYAQKEEIDLEIEKLNVSKESFKKELEEFEIKIFNKVDTSIDLINNLKEKLIVEANLLKKEQLKQHEIVQKNHKIFKSNRIAICVLFVLTFCLIGTLYYKFI